MTVFIRELKSNRKALIIWSICMFLGVASGMAKYTAFSSAGAGSQALDMIPSSLKALLGFGSYDITQMSGFFAFLFLYLEIALAIHAALLGAGILAKEERDKTTEFLMVKPVSRAGVVTAKLLAALVNAAAVNLVTLASCLVLVPIYNTGEDISREIAVFHASLFFVQLIFLSLGTALAAAMRDPKASGALASGAVVLAYFISVITNLKDSIRFLNVLSPFQYFSYADMANGASLDLTSALCSVLLAGILTACTYFFYQKRDLNV